MDTWPPVGLVDLADPHQISPGQERRLDNIYIYIYISTIQGVIVPHSKFYAHKSQYPVLTPYMPTPMSITCLGFFLTSKYLGGKMALPEKKETEKTTLKKQLSLPSLSLASPFPQHPVSPGQERAKIRDRIFEKYVFFFGSQTHSQYTKLNLDIYIHIYIYTYISTETTNYMDKFGPRDIPTSGSMTVV